MSSIQWHCHYYYCKVIYNIFMQAIERSMWKTVGLSFFILWQCGYILRAYQLNVLSMHLQKASISPRRNREHTCKTINLISSREGVIGGETVCLQYQIQMF